MVLNGKVIKGYTQGAHLSFARRTLAKTDRARLDKGDDLLVVGAYPAFGKCLGACHLEQALRIEFRLVAENLGVRLEAHLKRTLVPRRFGVRPSFSRPLLGMPRANTWR